MRDKRGGDAAGRGGSRAIRGAGLPPQQLAAGGHALLWTPAPAARMPSVKAVKREERAKIKALQKQAGEIKAAVKRAKKAAKRRIAQAKKAAREEKRAAKEWAKLDAKVKDRLAKEAKEAKGPAGSGPP